jgi:hypothetical protein
MGILRPIARCLASHARRMSGAAGNAVEGGQWRSNQQWSNATAVVALGVTADPIPMVHENGHLLLQCAS